MAKACKHNCLGGNTCYCRGDIKHSLHICSDEDCACHSPQRYGAVVKTPPTDLAGVMWIDMRRLMGTGKLVVL